MVSQEELRRCEGGEELNNLISTLNTRNVNNGCQEHEWKGECMYIDSEVW